MSGLIMGLVWEQPISETFKRADKYVLLAYADHADQNGRNIFPSIGLISAKTGYEERQVQRISRELEVNGRPTIGERAGSLYHPDTGERME